MIKYNSTKLFFDKYLYKVSINSQLATIFRSKNLGFARNELDRLQLLADKKHTLSRVYGIRQQPVTLEHFETAKKLLHLFQTADCEFKLRIEQPSIDIFSNDKQWLLSIYQDLGDHCKGFWQPHRSIAKLISDNPNTVVLKNDNGCQYKVTLSYQSSADWAQWVLNNEDKVKMGPKLRKSLKESKYAHVVGLYMYVRDEKILQMLNLLGVKIRRIDKIVVN